MTNTCKQCGVENLIIDSDRSFYERMGLEDPVFCVLCRLRNRMSWRNEKRLYKRKCDLCAKDIITIYSPDKKFTVYCQDCFWGDKWNALDYGMEIDFNKPFFEQFSELMKKVPRLAIVNKKSENSEYCNYSYANKNCYLTFGNHYEEDCLYGHYSTKNRNCVDYLHLYESELCYDCMFTKNAYNCVCLSNCENCNNCQFSIDLKGCKNCIFCANLRNKKYYIFNEEYSEEKYFEKLKTFNLNSYQNYVKAKQIYLDDLRLKYPVKAIDQVNCENCVGSNLHNSRNLHYCFDCAACEDSKYGWQMDETYDSMDMTCMGYDRSELCYETIGCSGLFNCISCDSCWHNNDLRYCNLCFSSKNCFGCISVHHGEYSILNKKYSKDEYEKTVSKVIDLMKNTSEWGQFFPHNLSPFGYNETVAGEYMYLEETLAKEKGFNWAKLDEKGKINTDYLIPDDIRDVDNKITTKVLGCLVCGKGYKVTPQEVSFYRQIGIPIPRSCSDCRDDERVRLRPPRWLWKRKCGKCGAEIDTTYDEGRSEKVYCENCYLKEVY